MRPVRLELRGFSAFREPAEIDFADIELVALVGATGAGKSSIIDAMTFALFGSVARYDEKAVAPVINQLSAEARVRLTFDVAGTRYTVTRVVARTKDGGGKAKEVRLECGTEVLASGKEVTERVVALLGLTFERFNKTVVLPQGRFQEFLHDKPAVRQELLRELLGLGMYERLAKAARERAKDQHNAAELLAGTIADSGHLSDDVLAQLQQRAGAVAAARAQLAAAAAEVAAAETALAALAARQGQLEGSLQLLAAVVAPADLQQAHASMAEAEASVQVAAAQWEAARTRSQQAAALARAGPSEAEAVLLLSRHHRCRELAQRLGEAQQRVDAAVSAGQATAAAAAEARERIAAATAQVQAARSAREAADDAVQAGGDRAQLSAVLAAHRHLQQVQGALATDRQRATEAAATLAEAQQVQAAAAAQVARLERMAPAALLAAGLVTGQPCPVCEQVVHHAPALHTVDHALLHDAQQQLQQAQAGERQAAKACDLLLAEVQRAEQAIAELGAQLAGAPDAAATQVRLDLLDELAAAAAAARQHVGTCEQSLAAAEADPVNTAALLAQQAAAEEATLATAAAAQLVAEAQHAQLHVAGQPDEAAAEAQVAQARALAAARDTAQEAEHAAQAEHQQSQARLAALTAGEGERRRAYEAARDSVAALRPPAATDSLVLDWQALVSWAAEQAGTCEAQFAEVAAQHGVAAAAHAAQVQGIRLLVGPFVDRPDASVAELRDLLVQADSEAQRDLADAQQQRRQLADTEARVAELRAQAAVARDLGHHLRADGFQGWLLEEAVHDLVARATLRLGDLTGGQYSLIVDDRTFRIVDHRNADEVRDARSLSGGETFLTSLALALALADSSMELAAEGSAPLESIFLDEGFGTLDPDTLEVVAGTIEELGATGRMVGIVTHIRELAERMPTRLEVTKGSNGSSVQRVDV
ncbi:MAG: SMC family ATPase [Actinomycetota bacterium]|nr:SMC family ATPase [Actinomycetota bacterium]